MFEELKKFKRVLVSGVQRSGTRIATKIIAHELGYKYIDEKEFSTSDEEALKVILKKDNIVVHAPAMSHLVHKLKDIAVVFVIRPKKDITASMKSMKWSEEDMMAEIRKYNKEIESSYENIVDMKYKAWWKWQKQKCDYPFELKYDDLKDHSMFISKEKREKLRKEKKWNWKSTEPH